MVLVLVLEDTASSASTAIAEYEYEYEYEKAQENMDLGSERLEDRNFKTSDSGSRFSVVSMGTDAEIAIHSCLESLQWLKPNGNGIAGAD
ncbi:MAG: hypothetical protein WCI02_08135 [Planctomycetota bacterium]